MNKEVNSCLRLFSNCKIVKGYARGSICDLQRNRIYTIPLSLAAIFDENGVCSIPLIQKELEEGSRAIFEDYLSFIIEHELGYYCSEEELSLFPQLPEEFLFPAQLSNAILDTDSRFEYLSEAVLEQLAWLGCHFIQLRCYNPVPFDELQKILELVSASGIKALDILLPFDPADHEFYAKLLLLVKEHRKISCLTITGADKDECLSPGDDGTGMMFKSQALINSEVHCGLIAQELFSINIPTYTESLAHNSCLNRKVAIDTAGNIKNCPSMKESFGNIKDTTLEEAMDMPGFQQYWNIKKAEITKCKDCEFRHVCTDCRAYLDDPQDSYAAPLKCGYDPYACTWQAWSDSPLKQAVFEYYKMNNIIL